MPRKLFAQQIPEHVTLLVGSISDATHSALSRYIYPQHSAVLSYQTRFHGPLDLYTGDTPLSKQLMHASDNTTEGRQVSSVTVVSGLGGFEHEASMLILCGGLVTDFITIRNVAWPLATGGVE